MIHMPVAAGGPSPAEKSAGDEAARKIDDFFESVADFTGLMGSLRRAFAEIDRASPAERKALKDRTAGKLAALSADLLRDLFENPLPGDWKGPACAKPSLAR